MHCFEVHHLRFLKLHLKFLLFLYLKLFLIQQLPESFLLNIPDFYIPPFQFRFLRLLISWFERFLNHKRITLIEMANTLIEIFNLLEFPLDDLIIVDLIILLYFGSQEIMQGLIYFVIPVFVLYCSLFGLDYKALE